MWNIHPKVEGGAPAALKPIKSGMRLRTGLLAGVALLVLALLGWGAVKAFPFLTALYITKTEDRLFYLPAFALTTDQTPVEFELRDRVLRVPKAYLKFKHQWDGGRRDEIFIKALLPDMEPPTDSNLEEFTKPGWNRKISIVIKNAEFRRELESVDKYYLGKIKPETRTSLADDLLQYDFHGNLGNELYIPSDRHPHLRYFTCSVADEYIVSPDCTADFYWSSKIHVSYSYSKTYLPDWQEVHRKVVSFVGSLLLPRTHH